MAIIGIFTDIGIAKTIEARNNEGFDIYPVNFGVSSSAGVLDPTRTTPNFDEWYRAILSGANKIDDNTIEVFCTIPPNQVPSTTYVREIYLFSKDSDDIEFLLAIGQPDISIEYNPSGSVEMRLQLRLNNADPSSTYTWNYTQATQLSEHKVDLNAHPDLRRCIRERQLFEYYAKQAKSSILRGGGNLTFSELTGIFNWPSPLEVVNPFYGAYEIPSGSLSSLNEDDILYTKVFSPRLLLLDGNTSGEVKLSDTSDFNDNDLIFIGDRDSVRTSGYVYGSAGSGENEQKKLNFSAIPTSGTWSLEFEGAVTSKLLFNSSAVSIKNALEALPNIDNVTVAGNFGSGFTITFGGVWSKIVVPALNVTNNTLKNGTNFVSVSSIVTRYGYGGSLIIDNGTGSPIDLSDFTNLQGSWIMRVNTSLYKGVINDGELKPTADGKLEESIFVVGIVKSGAVYLIDGREIRRTWVYEESYVNQTQYNFGDIINLPLDSRNSNSPKYYRAGIAELQFLINGILQERSSVRTLQITTVVGYNDTTGKVTITDDTSVIFKGHIFVDGDNNKYEIMKVDSDGLYIPSGLGAINASSCLVVYQEYEETGSYGDERSNITTRKEIPPNNVIKFMIAPSLKQAFGGGSGSSVSGLNVGMGARVFKEKLGSFLRFRTISGGAGISVNEVGDEIVISASGSSYDYFVSYVTGQSGTSIPTSNNYNVGTNKLAVFKNGVAMILHGSYGEVSDRYSESGISSVSLAETAVSDDVFSFIHRNSIGYREILTGQTGSVLTVPSYSVGSKKLLVYKNGVLLNSIGIGEAVDQYTETTPTSITLGIAAESDDVFLIEHLGALPLFRTDITGQVGNTIVIGNTYVMGSKKLMVYRNGVLLINSVSIGQPIDRYLEVSSGSISLETTAESSDVFSFINLD